MEQAAKLATGSESDPKLDHLRVRGSVERASKDKRTFLFEGGDGKFSFAICAQNSLWVALGLALAGYLPWTKPYVMAVLHFFGLNL